MFWKIFVIHFWASSTILANNTTFDELYSNGLEAYWNENWQESITQLEQAMMSYKNAKKTMVDCSIKCSTSKMLTLKGTNNPYEYILKKSLCIELCHQHSSVKSDLFQRVSTEIKNIFNHLEPYVYLQYAYYKVGEIRKSVAAAYTYSQFDTNDPMMKDNIIYFRSHPNISEDMFVNYEMTEHAFHYKLGTQAYKRRMFTVAVHHFEKALRLFLDADRSCRILCEGELYKINEFQHDILSFHEELIVHFRHLLECSITCPIKVAYTSKNNVIKNFLTKIYAYLHFSYYALNDEVKSLECIKSYLLFFPNSSFFNNRLEIFDQNIIALPRKDALHFRHLLLLQFNLLQYIYQNFGIYDAKIINLPIYNEELIEELNDDISSLELNYEDDHILSDDEQNIATLSVLQMNEVDQIINSLTQKKRKDIDIGHLLSLPIGYYTVDSNYLVTISENLTAVPLPVAEGPILFENSILLANSTQMVGPLRFALDNFASYEECQHLIDLELSGGISGDGYKGKSSPHSKHELFQGITVSRAVSLAEKGELPLNAAKLYYDISERIRQQVAAYFKLDHLYFDYTHLVCRTSINGQSIQRDDNSHPIHADNCILYDNGNCVKESPAYTWRDYSAIMYLNSDFEGGQFVMTDDTGRRVMVQVKPRCGRLVSFSAGKDCLHGVKPVTKGRRCALALWFTLDSQHDELLRKEAKKTLDLLLAKSEL